MAPRAVPAWRREPYRLLFPLAVALAWAGVLHWALHAAGVLEEYRSIFHAVVQIQGFMTALAVGFLYTFVHRRTGTAPPSPLEMAIALVAPPAIALAAWLEAWKVAEVSWLVLVATLIAFGARRLRAPDARGRFPPSFVWVPVALALGAAGALLVAVKQGSETDTWLLDLGRALLLQGTLSGLVLGVGGALLPMLTRGEPVADRVGPGRRRQVLFHAAAAALFAASFPLEILGSPRSGYALRAAIGAAALLALGAQRRPSVPGLHRRLVWVGAWLVPVGFAVAAAFPDHPRVGEHIVFIGGFATLGLAVSIHVILSHGGRPEPLFGAPWQLVGLAALLAAALGARALVDLDPERFRLWLGIAASAFLGATVCWAALVLPALWRSEGT